MRNWKRNTFRLTAIALITGSILLMVSCNDMLLQLGEHGGLDLIVDDASRGELHLSLEIDNQSINDTEPIIATSDSTITCTSRLYHPLDLDRFDHTSIEYVWKLNGENIETEREDGSEITIACSSLPAGEYLLQAWAIEGSSDPIIYTQTIDFTVEE